MYQDQGDASQVNRAYAYAYGRLYIYGPLALEIERTNQANQEVTEPSKVTLCVTIWKLGRTVCVYSMVQRREKVKDSRYIQEASAPAAVTVYQTCNIMYICNIVWPEPAE